MKRVVTLLSLSLLVIGFSSCKNGGNAVAKVKTESIKKAEKRDKEIAKGVSKIEFDKTVYDFGEVNEGEIVETTFLMKNVGKGDLVVTDAQTTCGCTVPVWPKEPVKPGDTAEIKVKFNTYGKPNQQSKRVTLYTNSDKVIEFVTIKGFVKKKATNTTK